MEVMEEDSPKLTDENLLQTKYDALIKVHEDNSITDEEFSNEVINLFSLFEAKTVYSLFPDIFDYDDRDGFENKNTQGVE